MLVGKTKQFSRGYRKACIILNFCTKNKQGGPVQQTAVLSTPAQQSTRRTRNTHCSYGMRKTTMSPCWSETARSCADKDCGEKATTPCLGHDFQFSLSATKTTLYAVDSRYPNIIFLTSSTASTSSSLLGRLPVAIFS